MHLKSNAQAKGGLSKRSYRKSQSRVPGVAIRLSSAWATAWKPDEMYHSRRAATAPARNAVEIALLRRRGATHFSAQRRRRRCDTPCANSFAAALLALVEHGAAAVAVCAMSAAKCGMLHEHSRHAHAAQCEQNGRVSIAHFERQWSYRVAARECCSVDQSRCLCAP